MNKKQQSVSQSLNLLSQKIEILQTSIKNRGVYSRAWMAAAGFKYTGDRDTTRCKNCGLEISNWTLDMDPFSIHKQQKPDCPYVQSMMASRVSFDSSSSSTVVRNTSTSNKHENLCKRQQIETNHPQSFSNFFYEIDAIQQGRTRTFSHWSQNTTPSIAQMIKAGFFSCDIGDRVICIHCDLICQQWTHTDDPCEVHKTLSPNCPYVQAKLIHPSASSLPIINENSAKVPSSNGIVSITARNPTYAEIPKRLASFATWPHENLSSIDALVKAGFFYTGKQTTVTCFYCNGSLENCGPNDNPMIRHARFFPDCAYAEQLCGPQKYRKIQKLYRAQQEHAGSTETKNTARPGVMLNTNTTTDSQQALILDETTLSILVSDRLDLPISRSLLDRHFKRPIIEKCWKNQLRIKKDDFKSEFDLYLACLILQKQIEHIDGKKENIVIPRKKMKQIKQQNISEPSTASNQSGKEIVKQTISTTDDKDQSTDFCTLCLAVKREIAFVPCGHLATCIPCGYSLQLCLICRENIQACCRIYTK